MVFDTTILGSNPSAPAKLMNMQSLKINFFEKIKKKLFPFYKSKELNLIFKILEKDQPKNKRVAMFVGGCVRKYLLNEEIDDVDIATIFTPEEIKEKFKDTLIKVVDTGIDHGSVTLVFNKYKFELTTLRKDLKTDGRHAEILYVDDWEEDSKRRDITINSIYLDRRGKIFDPNQGKKDLDNKLVKFIGDPSLRIQEDYLRIIRFLRFALQYNSSTDKEAIEALKLNLNGIKTLSKERILNELFKILKLKKFNNIVNLENEKLVFSKIFPELKYLDRIDKLFSLKKIINLDKNLILASLLIDESNNHEYFCHKYKVSNEIKNNLNILSKSFLQYQKDKNFFKKNLIKNIYEFEKNIIINTNIIVFLKNKKMSVSELEKNLISIKKVDIPKFPFDGKYLKNKGITEGKKIGFILKELKEKWLENNFSLDEKTIFKAINKTKN